MKRIKILVSIILSLLLLTSCVGNDGLTNDRPSVPSETDKSQISETEKDEQIKDPTQDNGSPEGGEQDETQKNETEKDEPIKDPTQDNGSPDGGEQEETPEKDENSSEAATDLKVGRLLVNHKEFLVQPSVKISAEKQYAEIPALSTLRALGVQVQRTGDELILSGDGTTTWEFDLSKSDFGMWVPDSANVGVRRIEGDEIMLDDVTIDYLLVLLLGGKIYVDYESCFVDVWVPSGERCLVNASLVINGVMQAPNEYVRVDSEYYRAELPLLLILREAGAQIVPEGTKYHVFYNNKRIWTFDSAKWDLGYDLLCGGPSVRRAVEGDLIFDGGSVRHILPAFDATIRFDYYNKVIYVNTKE